MSQDQQIQSFPLCWPVGWPRSKDRERSKFKTPSFEVARQELYRELRLMGAPDFCIVLSTNLPLRKDGHPYSGVSLRNGDPGVAVYFRKGAGKKQYVFACDRWQKIEDNVRAIARSIEAIRGIERWGASDMIERAFTGFVALPPPSPIDQHWTAVLGVSINDDIDSIEAAYREKIRRAHPDNGGSHDHASRLNNAINEARRAKGAA